MSESPRDRILSRLSAAPRREEPRPAPEAPPPPAPAAERVARLKALMEAMRTEVHVVPEAEWPARLAAALAGRGTRSLLYSPAAPLAAALERAAAAPGFPALKAYDRPVEEMKELLFTVEAAVTAAAGAVADSGALILVPDAAEPRLMSLVPPIHVAVLRAETIYASLDEALAAGRFAAAMPTNLLLISGPSKTADIELVLAFGVHGPKELIVLVVE
jgi:L-lactate dehydrogenase complex protein LldG